MVQTGEDFCREVDNWIRIFQQLLFIYRDTKIAKPMSLEAFLADAKKLYDFFTPKQV